MSKEGEQLAMRSVQSFSRSLTDGANKAKHSLLN